MISQSLKAGLIITGVVVVVGVAILGLNAVNRAKSDVPVVSTSSQNSQATQPAKGSPGGAQPAGNAQLNDGGGVQVQITYDPKASDDSKAVVFQVSLNTHSVELGNYDLARISRVTLQPGGPLTDFTFKPDKEAGGHHVGGTLVAADPSGLAAKAKSVILEIQGLAGVDVRRFEWPGAAK